MDEGDTRSAVGLWRGEPAQPLMHHPVWRQYQVLLAARTATNAAVAVAAVTAPAAPAAPAPAAPATAAPVAAAATIAVAPAALSARVRLPAAAPAAPAPEVRFDEFLAALRSAGAGGATALLLPGR